MAVIVEFNPFDKNEGKVLWRGGAGKREEEIGQIYFFNGMWRERKPGTAKIDEKYDRLADRMALAWREAKAPKRYSIKQIDMSVPVHEHDITEYEMIRMPIGSKVGIPCDKCEGHEDHTKLNEIQWCCMNCGDVKQIGESRFGENCSCRTPCGGCGADGKHMDKMTTLFDLAFRLSKKNGTLSALDGRKWEDFRTPEEIADFIHTQVYLKGV